MNYINLTPHPIRLNDGRVFEPSGKVARVSCSYTEFENDCCKAVYGPVANLPLPEPGTLLIVSALVKAATQRSDVVAPATGHPDCIRDEKGFIVSVPGFIV